MPEPVFETVEIRVLVGRLHDLAVACPDLGQVVGVCEIGRVATDHFGRGVSQMAAHGVVYVGERSCGILDGDDLERMLSQSLQTRILVSRAVGVHTDAPGRFRVMDGFCQRERPRDMPAPDRLG